VQNAEAEPSQAIRLHSLLMLSAAVTHINQKRNQHVQRRFLFVIAKQSSKAVNSSSSKRSKKVIIKIIIGSMPFTISFS